LITKQILSPLRTLAIAGAALISACATEPMGPTVQVLPGQNKPFEVFQNDQVLCKQYADQQVAGQADAANQRGLGEAVITTALGAGLGAAVGGGRGAGVGAAAGGLVGANVGSGTSGRAGQSIQQQYNNAYVQCMYAKGNQLPAPPPPRVYVAPPAVYYPAPVYVAPPPPGYYPAPAAPPAAAPPPPPPPPQ
jgi:hypothetical protein